MFTAKTNLIWHVMLALLFCLALFLYASLRMNRLHSDYMKTELAAFLSDSNQPTAHPAEQPVSDPNFQPAGQNTH
jgi:hypothetical protein